MMQTPTGAILSPLWLAQAGEGGPEAAPIIPGGADPAPLGGESTQAPGGQPSPGPGASQGAPGLDLLWILIAIMLVFIVMSALSQRRERKRRDELLAAIKRNDRVQTMGGIIGTVVDLNGSEVVLRVDESSNTRIRFARSAIQQVLRESKAEPEKTPA